MPGSQTGTISKTAGGTETAAGGTGRKTLLQPRKGPYVPKTIGGPENIVHIMAVRVHCCGHRRQDESSTP